MPKGLPKAKYPGLYTRDSVFEAQARGIQRTIQGFHEAILSAYSASQIEESTLRYCLSLIGTSDEEIQEIVETL